MTIMHRLLGMEVAYFSGLLKEAGLSKSDLAIHLGVQRSTISSWKDSPPQYVVWGLQNHIDAQAYRVLENIIKNMK